MNVKDILGFISGKRWNCKIRIFRELDGTVEELETLGRMELDAATGAVKLKSKRFHVDEPSISYRYFKSTMGKVKRVVYLYSPAAGVYRPVDYDLLTDHDKPIKKIDVKNSCVYCEYDNKRLEYEKEHKEKLKVTYIVAKKNFEEKNKDKAYPHFEIYYEKKRQPFESLSDYINREKVLYCCSKHINSLVKAKFKVIPEERKEWYTQRFKKRMERMMNVQKPLWENPAFYMAVFAILCVIMFVVSIQFGTKTIIRVIEESFKQAADAAANQIHNPPPN